MSQIPFGYARDRIDRRKVLIGTGVFVLVADLAFLSLVQDTRFLSLILVGASVFARYAIMVAYANNNAPAGMSIPVSGGLSMVSGVGSIIGPLIAEFTVAEIRPRDLFLTTIVAYGGMVLFTIWRVTVRGPVDANEKSAFQITLPARAATPETAALTK